LDVTNASLVVMQVPRMEQECFWLRPTPKLLETHVDASLKLAGTWELLDLLLPEPIRVHILNPQLETLYQSQRNDEAGKFQLFQLELNKRYGICVSNGVEVSTDIAEDRRVGIDIRVEVVHTADEILSQTSALRSKLQSLKTHQAYMKEREAQHRHTTEQTFTQLTIYTMMEYAALAIMSGGQVCLIRRFFEKHRYM
jgi:hypothetical protein